jgi:phosphoglycolate phosphatase-like HAD superfamily hydrolase
MNSSGGRATHLQSSSSSSSSFSVALRRRLRREHSTKAQTPLTTMSSASKKTLLTFDVDGTLIKSVGENANRFHKNAFSYGFQKIFGLDTTIDVVSHHGSTDKLIIRSVLEFHKIDAERIENELENVANAMIEYATENMHDAGNGIELLPGVVELLTELSEREDCIVTLVTGNLQPIAWAKMTQLGIKQYFNDIVKGGFGSDHEQRSVLVSIAHERATENGFKVNKRFHFGDTQNDITAAETSGAVPVGLATGIWSLDDLREVCVNREKGLFFESLQDTSAVLKALELL